MFNRHGYFQSRFSCRCGAHHVFNHNHKSYEKKMVEMLGGEGFDVIIEHLANINLGHDVQMLKNGARIMVVGCRGSVNINPRKYSLYYLWRIAHYHHDRSSCFLSEHKNVNTQKIILGIFNPSKTFHYSKLGCN